MSIRNHCCVSVREAGSYALALASFLSTPFRSRERALEKADYLQVGTPPANYEAIGVIPIL